MPNCPECVFKKRNVIIEEHKDDEDVNLNQLLDEVEVLMKFDPVTKHFICKRCGLYATRARDNCTKSCTLCSMGKTDISICTSAVHWKTIQQTV